MTSTDYILDIGLIALVLLQVRGRKLGRLSFILPIAIVAWAANNYLTGIPTKGNDLAFIILTTVVGAILGVLCGVFTSVRPDASGALVSKAGVWAAIFWVLGVGARFAFQLYATHGGGPAIERFSAAHDITSSEAWTAAILLMAIGEVITRSAVIAFKAYTAHQAATVQFARSGEPALSSANAGPADQDGWK